MNVVYVSLCAGRSARFEGRPKHLLAIGGETLIDRQRRQFGPVLVMDANEVGQTSATCETLILSAMHWGAGRVHILLGDAYYTDAAVIQINEDLHPVSFWTDGQDIFAISFHLDHALPILRAAARVVAKKAHNNGRLWELYRVYSGLPDCAPLPKPDCRLIRIIKDETQDFDTPDDFNNFKSGIYKNAALNKA